MQQEPDVGATARRRVDPVDDGQLPVDRLEASAMGPDPPETVVGAFHDQAFALVFHVEQLDVRPPAAAEGAEELRLIGAREAKGVVRRRRARHGAARALEIFVDAGVDDDPFAGDRPCEAENVAVGMGGQSADEYTAQMGLWALLASPLILGFDPVALAADLSGARGARVDLGDVSLLWNLLFLLLVAAAWLVVVSMDKLRASN